jgi:hypothetical protein
VIVTRLEIGEGHPPSRHTDSKAVPAGASR